MPEAGQEDRKRVLVIDDDTLLVRLIEHNLGHIGIEVLKAYTGYEGVSMVRSRQPDLVILDIVLPDIDGWDVLQRIRQISKVPILMLTIKEKEEDIVQALEQGADDYCTKPVGMKELIARVEAIFRRASLYKSRHQNGFNDGFLSINLAEQKILKGEMEIRLTPMEFNLVQYLLTKEGQFIKSREILGSVWGAEYTDDLDYVRIYIWHLRRKIELEPAHPRYIITEPGVGYRFRKARTAVYS